MFINETVLKILQIVLFALFTYLGAIVVERLMHRKVFGRWVYIIFAITNALLAAFMTKNFSTRLTFALAFIIMVFEIFILFHGSFINLLYGAMAIIINCMCFRGIVSCLIAMALGISFQALYKSTEMLLYVSVISSFIEFAFVACILYFAPLESMHNFIKLPRQKKFMLIWMATCVILIFGNAGIYAADYTYSAIYINQLFFCMGILMSCYFTLIHSYNLNKSTRILSKYQALSQELVTQKRLQSVLMRDAVFSCEANLSKNLILSGPESYNESFAKFNFNYDEWFEYFKFKIHPEDREYFLSFAGRKELIECFESGSEPPPFIYRRIDDGDYHWVKMIARIFRDVATEDVFVYGYSFDVDKEMTEKQELEFRAQTDSLTKLLNRETAEELIKDEIQKGCGALFLMDIDDFKDINDCMGHSVGDRVLLRTAGKLKEFFGEDNIVGRLGGDEFIAYLKNENDLSVLSDKALQLLSLLSEQPEKPDEPLITLSLGVAPVNEALPSFASIYAQADSALYEVKYSGKNDFRIFP